MPKSMSIHASLAIVALPARHIGVCVLFGALLFIIPQAQAQSLQPYRPPHPHAQTMSHCGLLKTRPVRYAATSRRKNLNTRIVQQQLQQLGYSLGRPGVDGYFGPYTRKAVLKFQGRYALVRDGIVGAQTARALGYMAHPSANVRRCSGPARMRGGAF